MAEIDKLQQQVEELKAQLATQKKTGELLKKRAVQAILKGEDAKREALDHSGCEAGLVRAEVASRVKSVFLENVSHEIRSSMNGIIGMTRIAAEQQNPPQTVSCLQKIATSSQFLLGLINDILDMTKAESGKLELHLEPYFMEDFHAYMDAVIRPLCDGKNQQLDFELQMVAGCIPPPAYSSPHSSPHHHRQTMRPCRQSLYQSAPFSLPSMLRAGLAWRGCWFSSSWSRLLS